MNQHLKDAKIWVEVQIAKGIKSIGAYAFKDCERLETVEMPDSVQKLEIVYFIIAYKLTNFQLPSNIPRNWRKNISGF